MRVTRDVEKHDERFPSLERWVGCGTGWRVLCGEYQALLAVPNVTGWCTNFILFAVVL